MPNNMVLLETIALTQSAASVTFDNLPTSGYTDLKVVLSSRNDVASVQTVTIMKLNGLTSGYADKYLFGSGSAAGSASFGTSSGFIGDAPAASATASTFGNQEVYIPNYRSSTAKSWSVDSVAETNATAAYMELTAGYNSTTSAITSIAFSPSSGNFVAGSTFSLYGIAALGTTPVTAPFATGGNIVANDGTYWYHAFLSSGYFVPSKALTCDYLVIAGGGAGGSSPNGQHGGGGGGAGGYLSSVGSSGGGATAGAVLSLTAQSYAVSVGAGGTSNANGTNTTFAGLTATGGGKGGISGTGAGSTGGSGGGGSSSSSPGAGGSATASPVQGYAGGNGQGTNNYACGGGGGAGAAGRNGGITPDAIQSDGGDGKNTLSTWASVTNTGVGGYYAGGGGGGFGQFGAFNGNGGGGGGLGGGGNGVTFTSGAVATSGTANTGGGGGGSSESGRFTNSAVGGNGGSGIVIVRYPMAS